MRKVFMMPTVAQANQDDTNSIHQIVNRLSSYLPKYGWTITHNPSEADLMAAHAGQAYSNRACDVAHCHGLYPTGIFPDDLSHWKINQLVGDNLRAASVITVPSQWVADVIAREFQVSSIVVPWAVDYAEWALKGNIDHDGFTLWNKTRSDSVCDPTPIQKLAEGIPSARFISTFANKQLDNLTVVGRKPYNEMKRLVQKAAVYVASTKETFGIGVLEAMACSIPILGFNWGAVPEYVQHGVSGFLAEPGDWQGLIDGWHYCMSHRDILGANARQVALQFTWEQTAEKIAAAYDTAYRTKAKLEPPVEVSVIIPCYNYGQYLEAAMLSVVKQETDFAFELIVVDDDSSDNTDKVVQSFQETYPLEIANGKGCSHVGYVRNIKNLHVAESRNAGIRASFGKYIVCLDADDKFGSPNFLQILRDHLKVNPLCGIAYTGLGTFTETEDSRVIKQAWPRQASLPEQFMGHNQIPTCCMFRREAWEQAKGYKSYAIPSEDAELWSRIFLAGYTAHQVTPDPIYHYRMHEHSLSRTAPAANWLQFHPWKTFNRYPAGSLVDGARFSWPVFNYDKPLVSIIIPVGPGHERHVLRALDSVYAQKFVNWECIVLNNSGVPLDVYPWVRLIECPSAKMKVSIVRNIGIDAAKAPLITFLDADDFIYPEFLSKTLSLFQKTGKYVYTDWVSKNKAGRYEPGQAHEYDTWAVFNQDVLHTINVLIPKMWLKQVGGFDETMYTWEDVDLWMKLASKGLCGVRLAEPLICYDYTTGTLREAGHSISDSVLKPLFAERYGKYMGQGAEMCNCIVAPTSKTAEELAEAARNGEMVRIEYYGAAAKHSVVGSVTKQNYGRRSRGDFFMIWKQDQEANPVIFVPTPAQVFVLTPTEMPPAPSLQK